MGGKHGIVLTCFNHITSIWRAVLHLDRMVQTFFLCQEYSVDIVMPQLE
jgi:hypothetical protein